MTLTPAASEKSRPDDLSYNAHRQLIGYIGLLLPALLIALALHRDGVTQWRNLESISAYYYTGAAAAFVGMLVALALFLFTYQGYANEHHRADRGAAIGAAVAALFIAFFPTAAPVGVPALPWWTRATGVIHHVAATVLFAIFAVFALWLFRLNASGQTETSGGRNKVYLLCGAVIVGCIAWAGHSGLNGRPIFWPESFALVAFAVSWLVKGYAHRTIARALLGRKSAPAT